MRSPQPPHKFLTFPAYSKSRIKPHIGLLPCFSSYLSLGLLEQQ
jgi:hypothetical protein